MVDEKGTSRGRRGHHSPIFGANCEFAAWRQRDLEHQLDHFPSAWMGAVYISYDLPTPRRKALSLPQVRPLPRGQMGELRLWDASSVHHFAGAVVAGASITGLRGAS